MAGGSQASRPTSRAAAPRSSRERPAASAAVQPGRLGQGHVPAREIPATESAPPPGEPEAAAPQVAHEVTDPEQARGKLPYRSPSSWNGLAILEQLGQLDDDPETTSDALRCSAVSLLGAVILDGPHAVALTAVRTMARVQTVLTKGDLAEANPVLADNLRRMLKYMQGVPKRLLTLKGCYKDLRRLSHMIKGVEVWNEASGTSAPQLHAMSKLAGGVSVTTEDLLNRRGKTLRGAGAVEAFLARVGSMGGTTILGITTIAADGSAEGHSVLAGSDARGPWIFNPWPREGDQVLYFRQHRRQLETLLAASSGPAPVLIQSVRMPAVVPFQ